MPFNIETLLLMTAPCLSEEWILKLPRTTER
jgi:hypothetical protein